eukprot:2706581-Prymnesium_polylepis.1
MLICQLNGAVPWLVLGRGCLLSLALPKSAESLVFRLTNVAHGEPGSASAEHVSRDKCEA